MPSMDGKMEKIRNIGVIVLLITTAVTSNAQDFTQPLNNEPLNTQPLEIEPLKVDSLNPDSLNPGPQNSAESLLLERLEATEKRVAELEAKQDTDFSMLSSDIESITASPESDYEALYDGGFWIRPHDEKKNPFSLRINGRMQFRYVGFSRDRDTFETNTGTVSIPSRNDFEIERGRLEFRGIFLDPNLGYYFNLDADTDDNHEIIFHDFWISYGFSDALNIYVGKRKVAGSYDWLESSTTTRFADRSLSTTFFRPDRSVGVWFDGQLTDDIYYQSSITNGFESTDLAPSDVDDLFAYSFLMYKDVLGDVGKGYSDLEWHKKPALRLGGIYTYSNLNEAEDGGVTEEAADVNTFSDGSNITALGALAPGVQINDFDVHLLSAFLIGKYQGWSVNAEFYARWLQNFDTTAASAPNPFTEIYDHGWYIDVGRMIVPKKVELIGRVSQIDGLFGDSWEYAYGVNWFLNGTHKNKITFDATILDGIPTSSSSPNFEIGQDGTLYRLQYQAAF